MKKIMITLICVACLSVIGNAQEKLNINISKSSIKWYGEYTFYFGGHEGLINFTKGYFIKTKDKITGGEFIIDMNSLISTDIERSKAKLNLENHLKDPDFFDVKNHPKSKLVITKVGYFENNEIRIKANLTIKGITKSIDFNAKANYQEKKMIAKFKIDRKRWQVNYTSKLRDGAISDAIGFEVKLSL